MPKAKSKKSFKTKVYSQTKTGKFITSYSYLNEIYDLNFSDNNFGFTWEVFKKFAGDEWALFFTSNCFYKWAPTARKTGKTWGYLAYELWILCNFTDSSMLEIRRYENTHIETTIGDLVNACDTLNKDFGIDLGPSNDNGIQWKINKDGGSVVFPNNQIINFIGYDNGNKIMGKAAKGSSFLSNRTDEIIMAEEKERLSESQLMIRYERLWDSIFRSNRIKVSDRPIKEFSWTFIDKNELSPTYNQKITRFFSKSFSTVFTCNPYDDSHPMYKRYVTPYLSLTEKVKASLKRTGNVWFEDQAYEDDLGLIIQRFTVEPFWNRIPPIAKKLMLSLKKKDPAEFETVFYGFEYDGSDLTKFPFRSEIKQWLSYNLEDFKNKKTGKYEFDFYAIGIDWATGSFYHSIAHLIGFKKIKNSNFYDVYVICELDAAPGEFFDETEKIARYIEEFAAIADNFANFENTIYYYDHNAETAINFISKGLIDKYDLFISTKKAIKFPSSINKEAGLADRVVFMKNLFSGGHFYANKEDLPVTWDMLKNLMYSESNPLIVDKKMLHDSLDSIFYAIYCYRNLIANKNIGLEKKLLFLGV